MDQTLGNQPLHDEKNLLLLASRSDREAFTILFHAYKNKLYGFIFRLTESDVLTEDVIQDVFMKLWNDHESLAEIENFGGYLFRMSKNHVINHFRRMAHETLIISESFRRLPEGHNETQEMIAAEETRKIIGQIVEKLPAQQKAVYHLSREDGLTHEEIGNLLNISPNTVKNHIVQAMSTIRMQLRTHVHTWLFAASFLVLKK